MIQNPGSLKTTGTEVAVAVQATTPSSSKAKRFARMAGAGVLSFGMMGVFALPAYAAPQSTELPFEAVAQQVTTATVLDDALPLEASTAELDTDLIEQERRQAEEEARAVEEAERAAAEEAQQVEQQAAEQTKKASADVPAGAGAQGLVSAALAQVGDAQDCTAVVERALRAIGLPAGDLGTQVWEYAQYGTVVSTGSYAPGDILIWPGQHVAIYIGNGQAVHGGWAGNQTVVAGLTRYGNDYPSAVVRVG